MQYYEMGIGRTREGFEIQGISGGEFDSDIEPISLPQLKLYLQDLLRQTEKCSQLIRKLEGDAWYLGKMEIAVRKKELRMDLDATEQQLLAEYEFLKIGG